MSDDSDRPFTVVDRRTWRRVEAEPPELPELPLARYCRERRELAAAQIRWAGQVVDLDEPESRSGVSFSGDSATPDRSRRPPCTPEERRRRIIKRLSRVRTGLQHVIADAQVCGQLNAFERDAISEDCAVIRGKLDTLLAAL
jgi:hypothetical protein